MIDIEKIKKLNAERTQGEWSYNRSPMVIQGHKEFPCIQIQTNPGIKKIAEFATRNTDIPDAHFIAAAPDIANLAIQLDEKLKDAEKYGEELDKILIEREALSLIQFKIIAVLEGRGEGLREALKLFIQHHETNWTLGRDDSGTNKNERQSLKGALRKAKKALSPKQGK